MINTYPRSYTRVILGYTTGATFFEQSHLFYFYLDSCRIKSLRIEEHRTAINHILQISLYFSLENLFAIHRQSHLFS